LEWARPGPTSLGRCCPAELTVESKLIHSPMFNCKKMEDARSGKRRRRMRRRTEEREADMAAVQSFTVAVLWRKAMVRSEEQFFFFSVQRHQSLFFSPPRLFLFALVFFFFFFLYASIPFLCSLLFFFPFVSLIFQSRPLLSMMSLWFFCPPPLPPGEGVFIGAGGSGATLPLSNHKDRVGWLGRPLYNRPKAASKAWLSYPFHDGGRP
jgi:hypothetical protein